MQSEEDQIIELLGLQGDGKLFEDTDFLPNRQSLYDNEGFIPFYDSDCSACIVWRRPHEFCPLPCYFHESFEVPCVVQGSLLDEAFVGVLCAVAAVDDGELIENIVYSRPDDFKQYGVFTCRFYVEGEWVEVITDTRVPCIHNEATDKLAPAYSRSHNRKEMWLTFIEKAYAKALGSYEAISKVRVSDLLMHLTGGSVQEIRFHEDGGFSRDAREQFSKKLKRMLHSGTILVGRPVESEHGNQTGYDRNSLSGGAEQAVDLEGLLPDKYYAVVAVREVNISELVLLHCPWFNEEGLEWEGDWSDGSAKWDEYPEVLQFVLEDPSIQWRRNEPSGFFWMSLKDFLRLFQGVYCCQVFQNSSTNYYFDKGDFRDKHAGGPLVTIRDREEGCKEAMRVEHEAQAKATASVITDGDSSWFTNPQYKITCSGPTKITASLIPVSIGDEAVEVDGLPNNSSSLPMVQLTIAELPRGSTQDAPFVGDALLCNVVATDRSENVYRQRGQEASVWNVRLTEDKNYFIVPNTSRRGQACGYVLRVFASHPITLERVLPLCIQSKAGEWTKSSSLDTTGGPPRILSGGDEANPPPSSASRRHLVDNSKWCQNSQFHVRLDDTEGDQDDVYLKIVLRRTDRAATRQTTTAHGHNQDCFVGFVVCKPEMLEEQAATKSKLGKPRVNPFGDVIAAKPSSLKRDSSASRNSAKEQYLKEKKSSMDGKITRKLSLDPLFFSETTTYTHKHEACMYFPRVPRSWMPEGLLVIPSLSEKGARGTFDLEVFSSKPIVLQQIKDQRCKSLAGDWVEGAAGGSHICSSWKRNPRFELSLKYPLNRGSSGGPPKSCPVRIALSKAGSTWRSMSKADAVACMIGFYVFVVSRTESGEHLRQIYETDFAPTSEVSTEPGFELDFILNSHDSYLIMPTTFEEGKLGSFVLTVSADCDFNLSKEHIATHK